MAIVNNTAASKNDHITTRLFVFSLTFFFLKRKKSRLRLTWVWQSWRKWDLTCSVDPFSNFHVFLFVFHVCEWTRQLTDHFSKLVMMIYFEFWERIKQKLIRQRKNLTWLVHKPTCCISIDTKVLIVESMLFADINRKHDNFRRQSRHQIAKTVFVKAVWMGRKCVLSIWFANCLVNDTIVWTSYLSSTGCACTKLK